MPTYVFNGSDAQTGSEPWIFDVDLGGSEPIKDIAPGTAWGLDPSPTEFSAFGTGALFMGTTDDEGAELWFTDGTARGTNLLADIAPGPRASSPSPIVVSGDLAYFAATTYQNGEELWVTDGTAEGTRVVADLVAGQSGSRPFNIKAFGEGVLFNTYDLGGLWYAAAEGVTNLTPEISAVHYGELATTNDLIAFSTPLRHPSEMWVSDGTPEGTDVLFGAGNPFKIARIDQVEANSSLVYFTAEAISGRTQLYVTDGTIEGTRLLVKDNVLLNTIPSLQVTDDCVLYLDDHGGLWGLKTGSTEPERLMSVDSFSGGEPLSSVQTHRVSSRAPFG